jgi:transcriptional regulator with XRE-family HTH domain
MDAEWFKKRQKALGLTSFDLGRAISRDRSAISKIINGTQRMTLEQAQSLAAALQVPLSEMLARSGLAGPTQARQAEPGFSESDAAAWIPGPGLAEGVAVRSVAEAMGQRPGVDVWRVKSRAMALAGMLVGDFFLLDTFQAERVRPGDVVVAQVYSRTGATTVMRRFEPPVLVAASIDPEDGRVHVVDGVNVVVRGKVVASWRLPG